VGEYCWRFVRVEKKMTRAENVKIFVNILRLKYFSLPQSSSPHLFSFEAIEKLANYGKAARNFLKEVS
jgi:hypothetical protein